jgi:hypothetical protein
LLTLFGIKRSTLDSKNRYQTHQDEQQELKFHIMRWMGNWRWVFLKRENKKKGESAKTLKWRCEEREDDIYKKRRWEEPEATWGRKNGYDSRRICQFPPPRLS